MGDYDAPESLPSGSITALASLRTRENIYLLALLLLVAIAYIAQQAIQRRATERKAFQRKARLLGISSTSTSSSATSSSTLSLSSSSSSGATTDAKKDGSVASAFTKHARTLARHVHLDACLLYLRDLSPTFIQKLFTRKGGRRRRKSTSISNTSDAVPNDTSSKTANGPATPAKETRQRAGTNSSSPSSFTSNTSHSRTALPNGQQSNTTHSLANNGKLSARPNGPSRHASSTTPSASSSRSRSATQSAKQQQRASSTATNASTVSQENKPVMKSIGIQVSTDELLGPKFFERETESPSLQTVKRRDSGKQAKLSSAPSSPALRTTALQPEFESDSRKSDFELACNVPLPEDLNKRARRARAREEGKSPNLTSGDEVGVSESGESGLKRGGTITNRSSLTSTSASTLSHQQKQSRGPDAVNAAMMKKRSSAGSAGVTTDQSSTATTSSVQSPTCSSSGRSTSLSISTDATGLTSIHGEQDLNTVPEHAKIDSQQLQPAVDLRETSTGKTPKKQLPNGLQYSFHSGFQEPTTAEEDEINESAIASPLQQHQHFSHPHPYRPTTSLLEASHILRQPDGSLYLPSSPDSQRGIRVDALGYPSIPLPPSTSSTTSSANNSPSSARRAVPTSRSPSATGLQSPAPATGRKSSNATAIMTGTGQLANGMYPASLGVQSSNMFPSLPTSPPPSAGVSQYAQYQQQFPTLSPHHTGLVSQTGVFSGPPLAGPQLLQVGTGIQQQLTQMQQTQYHHSMQQNMQQPNPSQQYQGLPSPAMMARPAPSPGLLNPLQPHLHLQTGGSSSGGSNRSSIHQSQHSVSSRSSSPHPSNASYSTEPSSAASTGVTSSRALPVQPTTSLQSPNMLPGHPQQHAQAQYSQYHTQQSAHLQNPPLHTQSQQHLDLVQKMLIMQAQIQFAMQQNEAQTQQAQAQAQGHQHYFQSAATAGRLASTSVLPSPLTAGNAGISSPLPFSDLQQSQSPHVLAGLNSSPASTSYAYQGISARSQSVASPHHLGQDLQQQQYQSPIASGSRPYTGASTSFPSIRRRQSTPALGADTTMTSFSTAQVSSNGSPFMTGKKRNRRNSRPFRMSSYGQGPPMDSPDFLASPVNDTSFHYDAEMDLSAASSSYGSSRPNNDRRRSSLIPPPSPLLNSRKERRSRQKERERDRLRQLELDDEEVTNNEDDIKADLEVLAQMQEQEDQDDGTTSASLAVIMKRLKSMETVLERRGKELEIAKWKLKCVEVDRRSIEAEVSGMN